MANEFVLRKGAIIKGVLQDDTNARILTVDPVTGLVEWRDASTIGSATNIYSTNGTLAGNRDVDLSTYTLNFKVGSDSLFKIHNDANATISFITPSAYPDTKGYSYFTSDATGWASATSRYGLLINQTNGGATGANYSAYIFNSSQGLVLSSGGYLNIHFGHGVHDLNIPPSYRFQPVGGSGGLSNGSFSINYLEHVGTTPDANFMIVAKSNAGLPAMRVRRNSDAAPALDIRNDGELWLADGSSWSDQGAYRLQIDGSAYVHNGIAVIGTGNTQSTITSGNATLEISNGGGSYLKYIAGSGSGFGAYSGYAKLVSGIRMDNDWLATAPHASAQLEIAVTNKGFLQPVLTATQRGNIATLAVGLSVYQSDATEGHWVNTSTGWKRLVFASEAILQGSNTLTTDFDVTGAAYNVSFGIDGGAPVNSFSATADSYMFLKAPDISFEGPIAQVLTGSTSNNYTYTNMSTEDQHLFLDTIATNKTVTLLAGVTTGHRLTLTCRNTGAGVWQLAGTAVKKPDGTTITSIASNVSYELVYFSSFWHIVAEYKEYAGSGLTDGDKGDITVSGSGATWTIDNTAVTYAKIQNVAANSFLANATGSAATVQEIATNRIPLFSSAITGTPSATTYLRGDGSWATPSGGGFTVTNEVNNRVITSTGAGTGNAEENLTFDGTNLTVGNTGGVFASTFTNANNGDQRYTFENGLTMYSATGGVGLSLRTTGEVWISAALGSWSDKGDYKLQVDGNSWMNSLTLGTTPANDDALTQVLVRDGTTGEVKYRTASSFGGGVSDGDKGDITVSASGATWTIDNTAVTLAKIQNIATASFLGRVTAATGVTEVLTGTQATTLLDTFTSALKGLAPASGGGTTNFLRADGTWAAPGGGVSDGDKGDITVSGGGATWTIDNTVVTYAKIQNVAANSFLANATGSAATVQEIATNRIPLFASAITGTPDSTTYLRGDGTWSTVSGGVSDGDKGDITVSGTGATWTIDNGVVTYAKMQNVAANSFLANLTGSPASLTEVATSRIPLFASAITGTQDSTGFLRGDGAWSAGVLMTSDSQNFTGDKTFQTTLLGTNQFIFYNGNTTYSSIVTQLGTDDYTVQIDLGSNAYTMTLASYAYAMLKKTTLTTAESGSHELVAQLMLNGRTVNAGTATVTNYATLYIDEAASGTATITNNYAFWVGSGTSRFSGNVVMNSLSQDDALTKVLVQDGTTGEIKWRASSTLGGSGYTVTTVTTTTHNETATSGEIVILVDTTTAGGAVTVNLPTAVGNTAKITIKKITGASSVTVDGNSTETIDGGTTAIIQKIYESITLISNNTNWFVI